MMTTKMTIRDIARLAGVSIATVSRVLNEKPDVEATTRERILRIMDEQRFVPSVAGAGLAGGRTGLMGVLVPSLTWAIMSPILSGITDVIEQTSHELMLYGHSGKRERSEIIRRIVDAKLIDGLVAIYPDAAAFAGDVMDGDRRVSSHLRQLHEQGFPVVVVDDQGAHDGMPWITSDNRQGALEAVRHLISLGHRRIAHIAGPEPYLCSHDRLEGYRAALREAHLSLDPDLEVTADFTKPGGQVGALRLFALPRPPTAIFAANDDTAYGVLSAARQCRLRVPDDVAIVGFDDAGPSAHTHPPLTTIRQPFFDVGKQAAKTLLALLDAPPSRTTGGGRWYQSSATRPPSGTARLQAAPARIRLPVELVERRSTTRHRSFRVEGEAM
jgi:LacI family transcriptional regulator